MLFGYELKKILRRVSPILVLIVLALTTIATMVLTLIFFNHTPAVQPNNSTEYTALQTKISNWDTTLNRAEFANAFNKFYKDYKAMNTSTLFDTDQLVAKYNIAKASFNNFYSNYYNSTLYDIENNPDNYLLISKTYYDIFDDILTKLNVFFSQNSPTNNSIINGLKFTNDEWQDATLQTIIENLFFIQKIDANDLAELKSFFNKYPANQTGFDYANAYKYASNRYWLAIAKSSTYTGKLSQYEGFSNYQDATTSTRACELAKYCLDHATDDFATPYEFGNIFNNSRQISLFDFIFTNLEMAMIPLSLLVMIWAACTFFTDHFQNTLITPIAAGKSRSTIILTKTSIILMLSTLALLTLTGIYAICGWLFFHAYISPDVLFLFNGTNPMTMSTMNYFAVYFLNLIFKLLPLIAICGLFSFVRNKPFVIVGFTTLICATVIIANQFLGRFWFYQFIPLMGLDPIRYFGAQLLFAPMPSTYNLWYTFPAMSAITIILYWLLIHTFRRHDF